MNSIISCTLLSILSLYCYLSAVSGDGRLIIKVINHLPCSKGSDYIKLPDMKQAQVVPDQERGEGCYKIKGGVIRVLKPIDKKLYAYAEIKNGTTVAPTECRNADKNNCGGSGSCCYCDICSQSKSNKTQTQFQLESSKKDFSCSNGIKPDEYKDESLSFCMPGEDEFLKSQHIDKAAWKQFAAQGTTIFCTIYFYTEEICSWPRDKLQKSAANYESIGCHKIVMNIKSSDSS